MSSNFQEFPAQSPSWSGEYTADVSDPVPSNPNRKEWALSALLFAATLICTTFAGFTYTIGLVGFPRLLKIIAAKPHFILSALEFSLPLILILLAHELGHFFACRYYGIRCTPPYFLPVPLPFTGTFGAFIKIKSPFGNRRELFDVGIAGPLAGFIVALAVIGIGIGFSHITVIHPAQQHGIEFGKPLIFRLAAMLILNDNPAAHFMILHPTAIAGLWGLLVTSLNLLPAWQLDGGHIFYAVFGRKMQRAITIVLLVLLVPFFYFVWSSLSYLVFCLMILILGFRSRFFHPHTLRDWEQLGTGRKIMAIAALLILFLSFTPIPIALL